LPDPAAICRETKYSFACRIILCALTKKPQLPNVFIFENAPNRRQITLHLLGIAFAKPNAL
jgi:hypothetical protein